MQNIIKKIVVGIIDNIRIINYGGVIIQMRFYVERERKKINIGIELNNGGKNHKSKYTYYQNSQLFYYKYIVIYVYSPQELKKKKPPFTRSKVLTRPSTN